MSNPIENAYDNFADNWNQTTIGNKHYSHQLLEKPAMQASLPNLSEKKVLALGCGNGQECQMLIKAGAKSILGVDSSKALIESAKWNWTQKYANCQFIVQDLNQMQLPENDFDFVYSSLTLHYLANWVNFLINLKKYLKTGSSFLFSIHHPIKWSMQSDKNSQFNQFLLGYKKEKKEDKFEIFGDYLNFREIQSQIMHGLKIKYYHRSFENIFQEIKDGGWQIENLIEPKPTMSAKNTKPDFYQVHSKIPMFLILKIKPEADLKDS